MNRRAKMSMNAKEIVILADQTPGQVSFHNFEEIKSYLEEGLSVYKNMVYTPENCKQAEQDLAVLKTVKKRLYDKKKELEKAYSMPIDEVKSQLDELISMVKEPMDIIDKMLKDNAKRLKHEEIMEYASQKASVLGEYAPKVLESKAFFNDRWLNISYKTKDWKRDVDTIISNSKSTLNTIMAIGGENKNALLGFYFDKLSLEGADNFITFISKDTTQENLPEKAQEDSASEVKRINEGYKIFKVHGNESQMNALIQQIENLNMEYEILEDVMPM